MAHCDQVSTPCIYMRGGSSKAVFFHEKDVPPAGPVRDRFLKRVMGTPDPIEIDGMGGAKVVTSKIALIRPSTRSDADIDYTFVQCGIEDDMIEYTGNCGNISSGVGPFAIDTGLLKTVRPGQSIDSKIKTQEVRIFNTGTKKVLIAHVPIDKLGFSKSTGDYSMDGVPGTGAPILMDYRETVGASRGKGLLPTGNVIDQFEVQGQPIDATICDVANICVFGRASDFGVTGHESSAALTGNKELLTKLREFRGRAAQAAGLCADWEKVDQQSPFLPLTVLIAAPLDSSTDVSARLFLDNQCHTTMAGTGSVCTTACSRIAGSVVNRIIAKNILTKSMLKIAHPLGYIGVAVGTKSEQVDTTNPVFSTLSFVRTSRRIMDGQVYVPKELLPSSNVQSVQCEETNAPIEDGGHVLDKHSSTAEVPATQLLASFVASAKPSMLDNTLLEKLRASILDYIGVAAAAVVNAESTPSIIAAVAKLGSSSNGTSTAIGHGQTSLPQYAAMINAALGHSMDFDDTYGDGALHAGTTIISTALAEAKTMQPHAELDAKFLTAIAIGYEITCRIGRELGTAAYSRGFHNTGTAGIFGAVAALAVLRDLGEKQVEAAFGFADSKAAGSMQYLENGSWNKRLHPGFAAHDAFVCVALAESGVVGAVKAIEGKYGLLHAYTPGHVDLQRLTRDLGKDWVWLTCAFKPFPGCRMTHGAIEMAAEVGRSSEKSSSSVKAITLSLSPDCVPVVGAAVPNKTHPKNTVDAQFSIYYQAAHAYVHGSHDGWKAFDAERIYDPKIADLCGKIKVVGDSSLPWSLSSKLSVEYEDGSTVHKEVDYPLGEKQHPVTMQDIMDKFRGNVEPIHGEQATNQICELVAGFGKGKAQGDRIRTMLSLLK